MIRDQGPIYNLGYGATSRGLPRWQGSEEERGTNPTSGVISKLLNKNPVMKFVVAGAATMAIGAVASSVVREGGIKLFSQLEKVEKPWATQMISDIVKVRDQLDAFQGVTRIYKQGALEDGQLFGRKILENGSTAIDTGKLSKTSGFFVTREEELYALRTGQPAPAMWKMQDEIQQRLVASARRMPYELPAFYFAQKTVVDPLAGNNKDPKKKVNWFNPVDVLTDFVNSSAKTALTMLLPFEAGTAASKQGWRRFMTAGESLSSVSTNAQRQLGTGALTLKAILGQVGADAVDITNKTLNFSSRTTGALSAGLEEAQKNQIGLVDYLHRVRHNTPNWGDLSPLRKAKALIDSESLLDLAPGPFRGLGAGIKAGETRYREILASQEAYKQFLSLGPDRFKTFADGTSVSAARRGFLGQKLQDFGILAKPEAPFGGSMSEALQAELGRSSHNMELLVRQWGSFSHGRPVLTPGANKGFRNSAFYEKSMQVEYENILKDRLIAKGVNKKSAETLVSDFNIRRPGSKAVLRGEVELTGRIRVNGRGVGSLSANNPEDFFDNLLKHLSQRTDPNQAALIRRHLQSAISETDGYFLNNSVRNVLDYNVNRQFELTKNVFLPQAARAQLKELPVEYGKFDVRKLSPKQIEFLQRKTASLTGLDMVSANGMPVSNELVVNHLRNAKIDPNNIPLLKGMLIDQGAMSKPWQRDGRNLFGFKRMTLDSAVKRGVFRSGQYDESDVRSIISQIAANDPIGYGGQFALGGAWESQVGSVLDFTVIRRGLHKALNTFASEYHIPLLKFNPLQMFNWAGSQELRDKGMFQFISGNSNQAFLKGKQEGDDFYLWMKSRRGTKGKVFAMSSATGEPVLRELQGTYRPHSAANAMFEKHARYAIRDQGFSPDKQQPSGFLSKLKDFFAISPDKPDSLFGYASRFRNRNFDLTNRQTFARLLSQGFIDTPNGRLTLQQAMENPANFERAARGFFGEMSSYGLSDDVISGLGRAEFGDRLEFLQSLSYDMTGKGAKTLSDGIVSLGSLKTAAQLEEFGQIVAREDAALMRRGYLTGDRARAMGAARRRFIESNLQDSYGSSYWDKIQGTGTRLDAYKRDLAKYLTVRGNALDQTDFNKELPDILSRISRMRSAGLINQTQATEARAALMSMQYDIMSVNGNIATRSAYDNLKNAIENFVAQNPVAGSKQVLDDIMSGKMGSGNGILGRARSLRNSYFRSAKYEYPGAVFNPFGSDTILAPTFRSTFSRSQGGSPLRAIKSVIGLTTYSDPESFSGMSVIQSHLVNRLNKPFAALGIGVDPTKFSGPLDMYARGLVGKRILPIVAAGTTAVAIDRTIGGYANEKDQYGNRVYSPYFIGKGAETFVKSKALIKGLIPGGDSYSSSMQKIENGEVPIRAGRWWPLGNTPFKGGKIQYFRPNWYRRLKSGYTYTDQTFGSPMERLAYGYDFSPLRPFDPYRFERKHYYDRPYPQTGDYFSGPWGPLTSVLNATVGKVLKPKKLMHQEELRSGLAAYAPVGDFGAYLPPTSQFTVSSIGSGSGFSYGGGLNVARPLGSSSSSIVAGNYAGGSGFIASNNRRLSSASKYPTTTASIGASNMVANINQRYASAAYSPAYGTVKQPGLMDPRIVAASLPLSGGSLKYRASQLGYETQELAGIYGFSFGALRTRLGLGTQDMSPDKTVLASASKAYGSTRSFWDLNLGGLGDFPLPMEGNLSNLEFSEITRRFIPKERKDVQFLNPIKNDMGIMYPWLPGNDYYLNFKEGDPYTHVPEGEMRLPGLGYERFNKLNSDRYGKYGLVDQHKILGDVAPWSQQYRTLNSLVNKMHLTSQQQEIVDTTRSQVAAKKQTNEFTPYEYTYGKNDPNDSFLTNVFGRVKERIQHADTYLNTKFMPTRTAIEDWERDNVYGATFPEWQHPVKDFLKPMMNKSTQRGPFIAASTMGLIGSLFGKTLKAKAIGSFIGGTLGLAAGSYGKIYENVTGHQYLPMQRKKEIALEEYTDILSYVRNMHLASAAKSSGNPELASQFVQQAKQTMYGADIYQGNLGQIALAIPKRKREHFKAMLSAPVEERKRILDTSGRLERRIYEAAWGMKVEKRPDLADYFSERELPEPGWEGYNPATSMDQVKIKIGQSMGLQMSEMGYYPQQIKEANLVNMSYPSFQMKNSKRGTELKIRELMRAQNIQGDVIPILTPYSGQRIDLRAGTF